ncbi:MAG: Rne/Rng family ribonuclease [Candidatus Saccharibacteria bacterium]
MERQIVIEHYPWETRVAIIEDGRLVELHIEENEDRVGNVYKGKVRDILPGLSCAFVDLGFEKNAFLYQGDIHGADRNASVKDILRKDQDIMVQVKKEELSGKGARITTAITIPGHYLVLLPFQNDVLISRKVRDAELRDELKEYLRSLKPDNVGLIVRTAGAFASFDDLREEMEYLLEQWQTISDTYKTSSSPAIIYRDLDITQRILRDYVDSHVKSIVVNTNEHARCVRGIIENDAVHENISIDVDPAPFEDLGLEREIKRLASPRVWLKSGGYLVIDETEAMTVIDVNSGKYTGRQHFRDTVLKTNLEAAQEIPRQLRLRGIGGIVLADFIDMKDKEDHEQVLNTLTRELHKDKARSRVLGLTRLGLVEMTRKKLRPSLGKLVCEECHHCSGQGRNLSPRVIGNEIMRRLLHMGHRESGTIKVQVTPEILAYLNEQESNVQYIKEILGKEIVFEANAELTDFFEIMA